MIKKPHDGTAPLPGVGHPSAAPSPKEYWRSLEELAETAEFKEFLRREFPSAALEGLDPVGRRKFLKLMAASLALAGYNACTRQPAETIVPYVRSPEEIVPGKPLFFATAMPLAGVATGLLVESHEGRPTKIEGNPQHPASLGATDVFSQASILTLYDPDRAQTITHLNEIRPWPAFLGALRAALEDHRARRGAGLRILTETVTSPTLAAQLQSIMTEFPAAQWHQYDPAGYDGARQGARLAFGEYVNTIYNFDKADVILALDSDFLSGGPGHLRYARSYAGRRAPSDPAGVNRLYAVESLLSNTGAMADHRLPLRPAEIEPFTRALASALGVASGGSAYTAHADWIAALARDLQGRRAAGLVIAGDQQSPTVHALAHAINQALGNVGQTVMYTDPLEASPVDSMASIRRLAQDMGAGLVDTLVILGVNPVYTAPADLKFAEQLSKVKLRIYLSLYKDETAPLCHWHIPEAYYLEAWGDTRAYDGTVSIIQPLIAPLYRGKSAHELLTAFTNQPERSGYDIVRDYWRRRYTGGDFEAFWRQALHDGVVPNTAFSSRTNLRPATSPSPTPLPAAGTLEIAFRPDPTVFDGRFANNGWLQELPKPLTKLTWDNAALVSPATAQRLGLQYTIVSQGGEHGNVLADLVELRYQGRTVRAPVWIVPGHADDCVTVHLGYGRTHAGRVGKGAGFNAYALRTSDAPSFGAGLEIRKTGDRYPMACTQFHYNVEGRDLIRSAPLEAYRRHPDFSHGKEPAGHVAYGEERPFDLPGGNPRVPHLTGDAHEEPPKTLSLYPEYEYNGYAWGMAIDVNACIGCNACVVACQSENNIPVVGKPEVLRGREMHWLRVDRYYKGPMHNPEAYFQPVPCMHCENAPCEPVCPVAATVHDAEGLNVMVYNRCVGTRYCSNNCPYKVRRFNFFLYQDWETPSLALLRNPDVTVRSRGVMEKCTYCVQRISYARIEAEKEGRAVRDGEIVTACQGACPADAIVFGDINDRNSRVAKLKADPRNYALLGELNTKPRTTYLGAVRNPNPEIERV